MTFMKTNVQFLVVGVFLGSVLTSLGAEIIRGKLQPEGDHTTKAEDKAPQVPLVNGPESCQRLLYNGFAQRSALTLNGVATTVRTQDGVVLRLAPAATSQAGSAFSKVLVNATDFSTYFRFRIGNRGGADNGADGIVFVAQPVTSAVGDIGEGMGYLGIANSVGVEFDTYQNASQHDPNSNHLGIDAAGIVDHGSGAPDTVGIAPDFDDGNIWHAWVDYDGMTLEARVSQSGTRPVNPAIKKTLNIPALIQAQRACVGFTSATGGGYGNHDILFWRFNECYSPINTPNTPPSISAASDQSTDEDTPTGPIAFTVDDAETPAEQLQVTASSSDETLFPTSGIVLGGTGRNRTVTLNPAPNRSGQASILVEVTDADGAWAFDLFDVIVHAVNDPPRLDPIADLIIDEDAPAQTVALTGISTGAADEVQMLTVTAKSDNPALIADPTVSYSSPNASSTLRFQPFPNANGVAQITVAVKDDGGTDRGGQDTVPRTFTVMVRPVNDPTTFAKGPDHTVNEDAGPQTINGWATNISAGPPNESGQSLVFQVTTDNTGLFSRQPAVSPNGTLTFTPTPNGNGKAVVTVILKDDGGTANGGVDSSRPEVFTITVIGSQCFAEVYRNDFEGVVGSEWSLITTEVSQNGSRKFLGRFGSNEKTTLSLANLPSHTKVTVSFDLYILASWDGNGPNEPDLWELSVKDGPVLLHTSFSNHLGKRQAFPDNHPAGDNPAMTWAAETNALSAWDSVYHPSYTFNHSSDAVALNFSSGPLQSLNDESWGLDNVKVEIITDCNTPPTISNIPNQTTNEDMPVPAIPFAVHDKETQATDLNLKASSSNSGLVPDDNIRFSGSGPDRTVAIATAPNQFGTASITITVADASGLTSINRFELIVLPVNDPPTFTTGADPSVNEDAGTQTINGWATNISAGPPNEADQRLTFLLSNDNPSLFSAQPAISPAGTLTLTSAPNANGSAIVTIVLKDDGGAANGGVDSSAPQTFTIAVKLVNDAPGFTKSGDQTVEEGSGAKTIPVWAANISAGPPDEASQEVVFQLSSDKPGMFFAQPAISPNGTLTFTPAPGVTGTATVTALLKDDGGTANGGVDASAPQTFTITITPKPVLIPTVQIIRPGNRTIFMEGEPIEIEATAEEPGGQIQRVEFYAGTTKLDEATSRPYSIRWPDAAVGDYVLTAKAVDAKGAVSVSQPVSIVVSSVCGKVAIVQNLADDEIDRLLDSLYELGVPSQVFGRTEATFDNLSSFDLIIWDDLGAAGLTDREVEMFHGLREVGKAFYFIGDALVTSTAQLSEAMKAEWQGLIHLQGADVEPVPGQVMIDPNGGHPIVEGKVGTVGDFEYRIPPPGGIQTGQDGEGVLGRAGPFDVLVAWEGIGSAGALRSVTQLFRVAGGGAEWSLGERKRLFQNAVWWLLTNCRTCHSINMSMTEIAAASPVNVGEDLAYTVTVQHEGECEGLGVVVRSSLSPGFEFKDAQSKRGRWSYDDARKMVTFSLGRVVSAETLDLTIIVRPTEPGLLTNICNVSAVNEKPAGLENNSGTNVTLVIGLKLTITKSQAGSARITAKGAGGESCTLETTSDLKTWKPLETKPLTGGQAVFEDKESPTLGQRFYRGKLEP